MMRNVSEFLLRARSVLEFSHDQDPEQTWAGRSRIGIYGTSQWEPSLRLDVGRPGRPCPTSWSLRHELAELCWRRDCGPIAGSDRELIRARQVPNPLLLSAARVSEVVRKSSKAFAACGSLAVVLTPPVT